MWKQRHWGVKPVSWSCAVCYWLSIDHIKAQEDMSGSIHDSLTTHHRTQRYNQALAHRHSGQQVVTLVNYSLTSFTESHQYYILSYDLCWCQLEITCPQWICSGPHVSLHAEQLQNWNTRLFHSSSKRLITLNMREHLRLQRSLEEEDITGATNAESEVLALWPGPVSIK